ncbi:Uncharacterised protein [Yersinia frederiksenii]|nr:Uncharacterised protein [Yersinia frederiksenii]
MADANSNIRAYSKLYTFLNARSNTLLAEISPLHLIYRGDKMTIQQMNVPLPRTL